MEAIQHGTLMAVHDGSYQPDLDPTVCSAALALRCSATGRRGVIYMAEIRLISTQQATTEEKH